jgi:hypothetical protein
LTRTTGRLRALDLRASCLPTIARPLLYP